MNILNLNDVPPPETPVESTRPPERPAAPTSSLDLSALTAPAPADAAEAKTEEPVQDRPAQDAGADAEDRRAALLRLRPGNPR